MAVGSIPAKKSMAESAWDAYEKTLAPVRITQSVMEGAVKAIKELPDHLRSSMHECFEAARSAYNEALDAESKAYDIYADASKQPTLFDADVDAAKPDPVPAGGSVTPIKPAAARTRTPKGKK